MEKGIQIGRKRKIITLDSNGKMSDLEFEAGHFGDILKTSEREELIIATEDSKITTVGYYEPKNTGIIEQSDYIVKNSSLRRVSTFLSEISFYSPHYHLNKARLVMADIAA